MNVSLKMNYPCELINIVPYNPLISKCQIKVCYVGEAPNRNGSVITKEVAKKIAASLPGSPIVGFFNEGTQDFEEHNREIEIVDGELLLKDATRPYGFVDLHANCWFQWYQDGDQVHEYLVTEGWIWTGQYPEAKRIIENGNNQSMELDPKSVQGHWTKDNNGKGKFYIISDAIISKLCVLGEEYEPCFEGAQITAIQFSLNEEFKTSFYAMIEQMQELLNKGGQPVNKYSVTVGDALWTALYSYLDGNYPNLETNTSIYSISGVYESEGQTFAVLHNAAEDKHYRLNFTIVDEGDVTIDSDLVAVEDYTEDEPQFSAEEVAQFAAQFKNDSVTEEENEEDEESEVENDEDFSDNDQDKNVQKEVEISQEYMKLEEDYNALKVQYETLKSEYSLLKEFKDRVDRKEKQQMIDSFYMLSDSDKADCVANIDIYSLDDIEAKLSIICVRNKVSFNTEDSRASSANEDVTTYNLNDTAEDDSVPAWIKAMRAVAKDNQY